MITLNPGSVSLADIRAVWAGAAGAEALRLTQRLLRTGRADEMLERMELENGHFSERLRSAEVKQAIAAQASAVSKNRLRSHADCFTRANRGCHAARSVLGSLVAPALLCTRHLLCRELVARLLTTHIDAVILHVSTS